MTQNSLSSSTWKSIQLQIRTLQLFTLHRIIDYQPQFGWNEVLAIDCFVYESSRQSFVCLFQMSREWGSAQMLLFNGVKIELCLQTPDAFFGSQFEIVCKLRDSPLKAHLLSYSFIEAGRKIVNMLRKLRSNFPIFFEEEIWQERELSRWSYLNLLAILPKVDYAIFPFQVNEKFGLSKKTQINAHQTATLIMRLTRGAQSCVSLVYKSPLYIFSMLHHDVNSPRNSWLRHWNPERCLFTLQWSCSSWVNVVKFSASERLHNCLVPQLCCNV